MFVLHGPLQSDQSAVELLGAGPRIGPWRPVIVEPRTETRLWLVPWAVAESRLVLPDQEGGGVSAGELFESVKAREPRNPLFEAATLSYLSKRVIARIVMSIFVYREGC